MNRKEKRPGCEAMGVVARCAGQRTSIHKSETPKVVANRVWRESTQRVHTVIAVTYQRVFLGVNRVVCSSAKRPERHGSIATYRKRTIQILARPVHYFGTPPLRYLRKDKFLGCCGGRKMKRSISL